MLLHDSITREEKRSEKYILISEKLEPELIKIMNEKKITNLFVIEDKKPIGAIHIHDLLKNGVA